MSTPGHGDLSAHANPFSLPAEEHSFHLRDAELQRVEDERAKASNLRVWEKTTSSSRIGKMAFVRDEDIPTAPVPARSQRKKAIEAAAEASRDPTFLTTVATRPAVGLLQPLQPEVKEAGDVRSYVGKKREMFLVQMALDVKKDEIRKLDERAAAKEDALTKSHAMLDKDMASFEEFLKAKSTKAEKMMKEAEAQSKRKNESRQRIKALWEQINAVKHQIGKSIELREECVRYKKFLRRLTPSEELQKQKDIKLQRKALRRENWVKGRMAEIHEKLRAEEAKEEKHFWEDVEAEMKKKRGKQKEKEREEERREKAKELQVRKKRLAKKFPDEKQIDSEYVDVSSEEEYELYFKEPGDLMACLTELEEKNLFLIQNSQETEQVLEELGQQFEKKKEAMSSKVKQLKLNIRQLEQHISQEKKLSDDLRTRYNEKAGTQAQDDSLAALDKKVRTVFVRCGFSMDHDPNTLQMLGQIEAKLEELLTGLEEAKTQDSELVLSLEWQKERERRDRARQQRLKQQVAKQEERLKSSLLRSQAPVFKKAGKQAMYRSPPLRQERKEVKDTSEDEANARDHSVFGMYVDRRSDELQTELPEPDDHRHVGRAAAPAAPAGDSRTTE